MAVRIDEAVFSRLSTNAALAAVLTSPDGAVRVYPLRLPETLVLPAVTYQRISGVRDSTFTEDWRAMGVFQFDCWAATYAGARSLADLLLEALQRADYTAAGVTVLEALVQSERDLYEAEARLYRVNVDLELQWRDG